MSPKSKGSGKGTTLRKAAPGKKAVRPAVGKKAPGKAAKKASPKVKPDSKKPSPTKAPKKAAATSQKAAAKKPMRPAPKAAAKPAKPVKPIAKPVTKAVTKPAVKPVPKAAAKPVPQPAAKPDPKPVAKPAPPPPAPKKPAMKAPEIDPPSAVELDDEIDEIVSSPFPRPLAPGRSSPIGISATIEDDDEEAQPIRPVRPPRAPLPPSPRAKPLVGPPPPGPKPVAKALLRPGAPSEPLWDALPLPDDKAQLKRWYQTAQMPSPMGGFLEPLRVKSEDDGSGTVIFECSASSLRFEMKVPAASRGEKKTVKDHQDAGEDPNCPRHDPPQRLNRVGPYLVCPLCGVRYGKVSG